MGIIETFIRMGIAIQKISYNSMKRNPVQKRVLIMSRQSDEPTLDIKMLVDELNRRDIETVVLCKKLESSISAELDYYKEVREQMRYLATSKVVVLDSYNIPVSVFKAKEETTVIQMWHALGSMKKFGRSILDMPEGSSSSLAEAMKMHEGYDYILTSSKASMDAFAEAFGYPKDKFKVMSLPRVDAVLSSRRNIEMSRKIRERYPELTARKTILYAPTLRRNEDMTDVVKRVIDATDTERYNLIIKIHPLSQIDIQEYYPMNVVVDTEFETIDMLSVANYVITDYSAFTYEAALSGLPIYFYAYDKEKYINDRSFYLDYNNDMPGPIFGFIKDVIDEIESGRNLAAYIRKSRDFADKYIEKRNGCTKALADFIEELL